MKTRAERRHHHNRMIERVKNFHHMKGEFWMSEEDRAKHIKQIAENRHPCSCHMCRNPRHSGFHKGKEKLTMQERKAARIEEDVQL